MASAMEQSSCSSRRYEAQQQQQQQQQQQEFNLREWALKARVISRENTMSRRFSASYIRREDTRSFRSNITISSTASSPGYSLKDEIDPTTYSFTTALRALQARTLYNSWECLSPDGFALNSKWNDAEKYICNPLSGEVPMECLSSKTLSGRSFRNLTSRITMSAPLVYSSQYSSHSNSRPIQAKTPLSLQEDNIAHSSIPEKKMEGMTRDVGTQSTPPDLSSSSPSPTSTPSIIERSLRKIEQEAGDSPNSNAKLETDQEEVEMKETREKEKDTTKRDSKEEAGGRKKKEEEQIILCRCSMRQGGGGGGCLSWMRKRQREKHKPRKRNFFFPHLIKGC